MSDLVARKDALLEATLPEVTFDGWSLVALRNGAKSAGIAESEIALLFPDGPGEAALWLDDWADRKMLAVLDALDLAELKVRRRVAAGVEARLTDRVARKLQHCQMQDALHRLKEQSRLLTYILKYSGFAPVLPEGWVADCKRILGEDSNSTDEVKS